MYFYQYGFDQNESNACLNNASALKVTDNQFFKVVRMQNALMVVSMFIFKTLTSQCKVIRQQFVYKTDILNLMQCFAQ